MAECYVLWSVLLNEFYVMEDGLALFVFRNEQDALEKMREIAEAHEKEGDKILLFGKDELKIASPTYDFVTIFYVEKTELC